MRTGTRVKIANLKNLSEVYDDIYNPKDMEGTVVNMNGKYCPIEVRWDNGIRNAYYEYNLKRVEE